MSDKWLWDRVSPQQERLRLRRNQAQDIAEIVRSLGFRAHVSDGRIHIHDPKHPGNDKWIGCLHWTKRVGWGLYVMQPPTYTQHDLQFALEELQRTSKARRAVVRAWGAFNKCRSEKNWRAYQGAIAAHYFRMFPGMKPEEDKTDDES
jgi:hypothetical protein